MKNQAIINVYGAEILCASCVNMPSSQETYGWLEAALARKFPGQPFQIQHIDIFNLPVNANAEMQNYAERARIDELFYPLVTVNGTIVGEGDIRLKKVSAAMEALGYQSESEANPA